MKLEIELRRDIVLRLVVALLTVGGLPGLLNAAVSSHNGQQIGRILSLREVPRWQPYPLTLHPQIHYCELFFSVRVSDQAYCAEYITPVLNEIDDLFSSNGKDVEVVIKKRKITARTPSGHKIKAHLVKVSQCSDLVTRAETTWSPPLFISAEDSRKPISNSATETPRATPLLAPEPAARVNSSEPREVGAGKLITDPLIKGYVNRLAQKIVAHSGTLLPTTVEVIESQEISAFVLPGRHFYLNSGLILASDSEAELASILAHEIAHMTARHEARIRKRRRMWTIASFCSGPVGLPLEIAGFLSSMKSHRDAEREADRLGLEYEYEAGNDPRAFVQFLEKVNATDPQRPSLIANAFETHPPTLERIRRAQREISTLLPPKSEYILDTSEFQQVKSQLAHVGRKAAQHGDRHSTNRPDFTVPALLGNGRMPIRLRHSNGGNDPPRQI